MTTYKILILDDKPSCAPFNSNALLKELSDSEKNFVELYNTSETLWKEDVDTEELILLRDFSDFPFIFIHDSYDDPLVSDGQKGELLEKLLKTSTLVLFSGAKKNSSMPVIEFYDKENSKGKFYAIGRTQYFENMSNFLEGLALSGKADIRHLYDVRINPKREIAYRMLELVREELEVSVQHATKSNSFRELLVFVQCSEIEKTISKVSELSDEEFIEFLEKLIEN